MPPPFHLILPVIGLVGGFVTLWVFMALRPRLPYERNADQPSDAALAAVEQRLARLEVAVDDMTAALAQVKEGQQMVTRLLGERAVDRVSVDRLLDRP
jgi:hypothetical protein